MDKQAQPIPPTNCITPLAYFVFLLASCFYLYEFILQVAPAVMTHGLMRDYRVEAAGLGLLSSVYYLAYTPMQIPAGILFDRFGPRLLLCMAILLCALGTLLFSISGSIVVAAGGRLLMGAGSAFSFIGVLVILAHWFPARQFALLAGITQLMSSVGAILGENPLEVLIHAVGWRSAMLYLAAFGIGLAVLVWIFVRDYPPTRDRVAKQTSVQHRNEWQKLLAVTQNSQTWFVALYAFFIWAPITIFPGLWGVPYLHALYPDQPGLATGAVSMIWIGIGVGSPGFGWWSDRIGSRNTPLRMCALFGLFFTTVAILPWHLPVSVMYFVMFGFGLAAGGQTVSFAVVKDNNHANQVGTACGFNNMATVAGGLLMQPLVGFIVHHLWFGESFHGVPIYHIATYRKSLVILPLCYCVALVIALTRIKETYCRSDHL